MALMHKLSTHVTARIAFGLLMVICVVPFIVRNALPEDGPFIEIVQVSGHRQTVSLAHMKTKSTFEREGSYQNQYGNWRDQATYAGVLLTDLLIGLDYSSVEIVADDGYAVTMERSRVEDPQYPMVLAYRRNGIEVPQWEDGFCIAVLPADGGVGNEEYGVESAGSYWVKRVARLILNP